MTARHRLQVWRIRRPWALAGAIGVLVAATVFVLVEPGGVGSSAAPVDRSGVPTAVTSVVGQHPSTPATSASLSLPPLPATPGPLVPVATPHPVSVSIPAIGVTSGLEVLGQLADGTMAPPSTYGEAGWFAGGTVPGDVGPAVLVGHVDSYQGPGVFYRLPKLQPGAQVTVTRADGRVLVFTVESSASYPKTQFPTSTVYGATPTPELVLVTCTGSFDEQARSYRDNLVVRAVLTG